MDKEHIREIMLEEAQDRREEPMRIWIEENQTKLELEFVDAFAPEDQPLDDDYPDFLDYYADDFEEYCKEKYREVEK